MKRSQTLIQKKKKKSYNSQGEGGEKPNRLQGGEEQHNTVEGRRRQCSIRKGMAGTTGLVGKTKRIKQIKNNKKAGRGKKRGVGGEGRGEEEGALLHRSL